MWITFFKPIFTHFFTFLIVDKNFNLFFSLFYKILCYDFVVLQEFINMPTTITNQKALWSRVLTKMKTLLQKDAHNYQIFYSELKLFDIENDTLKIIAPTLLVKSFLSTPEHSKTLKEVVEEVFHEKYNLAFYLFDELESNKPVETEVQSVENRTYFANCKLNSKYIFDSFVIGSCNKEAATAASMVANDPGKLFNPLFIYSKSGLGKTHLLHSIGNYYKEKHPNANVLYITTDAFIDEFIKYVHGSQDNQSLKDFFKTVDLLLVDDIQFLSSKAKTSEMFFYIFNSLVNNGKQIVLTADRHPRDLKDLEDRLVSRFNMGLSVNIQNPDTETLLKILKKKIVSHGLSLENYDEEGLLFLAETFSKNVRELEGALNRLLFHTVSLKEDKQITLEDIQEAVNIMMPKSDKKKLITETDIIEEVAKYYNISSEQIMSSVRNAQIALARRISMYLCRTLLGMSYVQIGHAFKRDHSTVITAVDKVGREIKLDNQLALAISDVKKALKK